MKTLLVFCSLILLSMEKNEVFVLRAMSKHIGDMVIKCQKELEFKNDVIRDLMDFWNEKNELGSTDLGCALVCVFEKNELLNEDGSKVQIPNVKAFFMAAGADEFMSRKMAELSQLCKKSTKTMDDLCDSALEIAKCFRYGIFRLHWEPERDWWNRTEVSPDSEPDQVSDENNLDPAMRREMNARKMFSMLFRSCRK